MFIGLFQMGSCILSWLRQVLYITEPSSLRIFSSFTNTNTGKSCLYTLFLHSGFWMVKFVPIYTPTKSKKWSELLMGENVSVLVSLLVKLDQRSSLMPQLIPCVCIDVSENKGDSRPELLLLWLFSSTLFEIAVLAVDHNLWFLFWQLSMGFCCCFWFS